MFPKLEGPLGPRMRFEGVELICWSINNYLGLARHPEIIKSDEAAAREFGLAHPMGARMMSGDSSMHEQLEQELATLEEKEASNLLNFGYQGILSIIDALLNRRDVVIYDSESHACIVDGVRLHQGKRYAFNHNDIESLEQALKRAEKLTHQSGGGILVISEGVFGMRGDLGKLREITDLKRKYSFRLLVDDAHGFGVFGARGGGTGIHMGVQKEIDLYFATFAKSMASIGAFVAGDEAIIRFLKYNMRSQIFAKSLPSAIVVGALKRLDLLKNEPSLRDRLWKNVIKLQSGLKDRGLDIGNTQSCVTPIYLNGTIEEAMRLVRDLRENYLVFCSIVVYPVIPKGLMILRLIPTAMHTDEDIVISLKAFAEVAGKLENGNYR